MARALFRRARLVRAPLKLGYLLRRAVLVLTLCVLVTFGGVVRASAEPRVERNVVYGMYGGLALLMDVFHPESPNGYGVIFISGSGWYRDLDFDATPLKESGQERLYGLPLAEAGYTVFAINHRATPRFQYPAHLEDAQRAVRFVRHHASDFAIDEQRIGAVGGSSGAHLVSLLGVLDGDGDPMDPSPVNRESAKVQTVVARAAPLDLTLRAPSNLPSAYSFMLGFRWPAAEGTREFRTAVQASPITHVSRDDPPFLLIHGDADETVVFENSEVMKTALERVGVPVELMRIAGGGHGARFPGAENPPDYIGAMVEWLNQHLLR